MKQVIPISERPRIAERYKTGETLAQIADTYGVSRERIRQILVIEGVSAAEGGQKKRTRLARQKTLALRDSRCRKTWHISLREYRKIVRRYGSSRNPQSPLRAFVQQRANAHRRSIEWDFTFKEWWDVWLRSGQWENRGRENGKYVMARFGDTGAYCRDNVHIVTSSENITEYWSGTFGTADTKLAHETRALLSETPESLRSIARMSGLSYSWLRGFRNKRFRFCNAVKVKRVHRYLVRQSHERDAA